MKTLTWNNNAGSMTILPVTNNLGPGATASETYLEVSDTGALINYTTTLNLGSGIRMIKCKVKMIGTGEVRFGGTYGRKMVASNYTTWQDVDFCSSAGFLINFRQASNGLKIQIADIQLGAIINTNV